MAQLESGITRLLEGKPGKKDIQVIETAMSVLMALLNLKFFDGKTDFGHHSL